MCLLTIFVEDPENFHRGFWILAAACVLLAALAKTFLASAPQDLGND